MSRFFRASLSSTSSEGDTSDSEELSGDSGVVENISTGISQLNVPQHNPSSDGQSSQILLHALLEERCMNEVLREHGTGDSRRSFRNDASLLREARSRYQELCAALAHHNLISTGLEHDEHSSTRQRVRDGLDVLSATSVRSSRHAAVPPPLRRLLTDTASNASVPTHMSLLSRQSTGTTSTLDDLSTPNHPILNPSRYLRDFDELGLLGKGGYGMVFHVKHKLDDIDYAVKKVPISAARIARIRTRGQTELEELTREVRTLAKLDHPNIVRYHAAWIEWSNVGWNSSVSDTPDAEPNVNATYTNGGIAAEATVEKSKSLMRVTTESDSQSKGILFESSASQEHFAQASFSSAAQSSMMLSNSSFADGTLFRNSEPTLALHLQMGLYPLTLADFISPPSTTNSSIEPLVHCFHLEPTVSIMQALTDGVEYLHNENVVHRDLKPANIFVAANRNPRSTRGAVDLFLCTACRTQSKANPVSLSIRIGDFGLVTEIARPNALSTASPAPPTTSPATGASLSVPDTTVTNALTAVGTEIYRPPSSQAFRSNTDAASLSSSPFFRPTLPASLHTLDIFALGIIFFELLYKFSTRMERHDVINRLKYQGEFPGKFGDRILVRRGWGLGCDEEMGKPGESDGAGGEYKVLMGQVKRCIREMLGLTGVDGEGEEVKPRGMTTGELRKRLEEIQEGMRKIDRKGILRG